ncbi:MAG: hypothetical protein COB24_08710 [Hyphomicrobiales bacterium]|nr:MAG: hypothetical protein COB24_08710 [Hyphomicrobiales bacterium]
MSDYNNDSNDDLPADGKDAQAEKLTDDQYADAQFPQAEYAEGQVEEEYVENVNSYYTNEYQTQDYYETPVEGQPQEQTEPVIFVNQSDESYTEDDNIYSTELPNYQTNLTLQHNEPPAYAEAVEYVAPDLNAGEALNNDEGYVAADEYLEPDIHAKSDYVEPLQTELGQTEPVFGGYVAETYPERAPAERAYTEPTYVEPAPTEQTHLESGFAQPQYSESNVTEQEYAQPSYTEAGYVPQPHAPAYDKPQMTAQGGYEQTQYASDEYASDEYATNRPNYDNVGHDESGQLQAIGDAPVRDSAQQDFKQEYVAETSERRNFIIGGVTAGLALILVLGGSFYYLYTSYVNTESAVDVPVILADKSEIKTFPNADSELQTTNNGSKNTDRIESGATDVGQGVTVTEPALLDSREDVVDEATKSEDRVEISDGVVADNDDKDIQNVLTLIKSGADNVEILLKPEDVNQLDQNQINIDGLETILVDAKPVKLSDLIAQANQLPQSTIERVTTSNVDDLPVVDANDLFKKIVTENNTGTQNVAVATELPEATAQPLPETDLSNAIAIASNQIASNQAVNVVAEAPKPVIRPTTVPTSVPNSLSPVVAASGGAYGVQLASLPSEAGARQAYLEITAKFPNILAGYSPIIREAIIPNKGTFYRVFAGPIISYNDANQLCANLRSAGISGCFARKM